MSRKFAALSNEGGHANMPTTLLFPFPSECWSCKPISLHPRHSGKRGFPTYRAGLQVS
jgi:hypothetical protein